MPSAAVAGHYEIFNALQSKTKQNNRLILKKLYIAVKFYQLKIYSLILKI